MIKISYSRPFCMLHVVVSSWSEGNVSSLVSSTFAPLSSSTFECQHIDYFDLITAENSNFKSSKILNLAILPRNKFYNYLKLVPHVKMKKITGKTQTDMILRFNTNVKKFTENGHFYLICHTPLNSERFVWTVLDWLEPV